MEITLLAVGKTDSKELQRLVAEYSHRIGHYMKFGVEIIPDIKNAKYLSENEQREKEGALIMQRLKSTDLVYLLDEKGKQYTSVDFASFLQKQMNRGTKRVVFIIGGPYGFSQDVYSGAHGLVSLSKMTFPHQLVRLFATEQLYRAFTILKNEPYHHR